MKVTIVPIVIGAFGTVTKGLLKSLEDLEVGKRVETIQTTALLRRPKYWEESWRLEETCCHSNSSEKPSAGADVKNSKGVNNNNNNNDFVVPADERIKMKDFARELKNLRNINETVILVIVGVLRIVLRGSEKRLLVLEIRGRIGTIQTIALPRSSWILRRAQETWGDLLSLRLLWKTTSWWIQTNRQKSQP